MITTNLGLTQVQKSLNVIKPKETILKPNKPNFGSGIQQTSFLKQIKRSKGSYKPSLTTDLEVSKKRINHMNKKVQEAMIGCLRSAYAALTEGPEPNYNDLSLAAKHKPKTIEDKKKDTGKRPVYDPTGVNMGKTPNWSHH